MDRTLLYIAHGFPPASGSGPNRALAFARYLPENGWRPVVLTAPEDRAAPFDGASMLEIPADLRVIRTSSLEPKPRWTRANGQDDQVPLDRGGGNGSRRHGRVRSHLGHARRFPDAHRGWTPGAILAGLAAIKREQVSLLYSTAGPYTDHVVALALHGLTGLPWVAELRDGWYEWNRAIFPDYPAWRGVLESRLESAVITRASGIVLMTDLMAEAFRRQYAARVAPDQFHVVRNGFDPARFEHLLPVEARGATFRVLHAGAIYHGRSIGAFLEAAGRLAEGDPLFRRQFSLSLVGSLDATARAEITNGMQRYHLQEQVRFLGFRPHAEVVQEMCRSHLLLALANTTAGAKGTVPAKVYEYLAVRRPVLLVAPDGSESAQVVRDTGSGWVGRSGDASSIQAALADAFAAFTGDAPYAPDESAVARFNRRDQAAQLASVFNRASGASRT